MHWTGCWKNWLLFLALPLAVFLGKVTSRHLPETIVKMCIIIVIIDTIINLPWNFPSSHSSATFLSENYFSLTKCSHSGMVNPGAAPYHRNPTGRSFLSSPLHGHGANTWPRLNLCAAPVQRFFSWSGETWMEVLLESHCTLPMRLFLWFCLLAFRNCLLPCLLLQFSSQFHELLISFWIRACWLTLIMCSPLPP